MSDVVKKPFKTVNRRFKEGDLVRESDIEGAITFEDWKRGGFIAPAVPVSLAEDDGEE